jgi:hypothetical protein
MARNIVSQSMVGGVSPGGRRRSAGGLGRKSIAKIISDTERMKNTPLHVCAKIALLVDLQQKVGEIVISTISCPSVITLEQPLSTFLPWRNP